MMKVRCVFSILKIFLYIDICKFFTISYFSDELIPKKNEYFEESDTNEAEDDFDVALIRESFPEEEPLEPQYLIDHLSADDEDWDDVAKADAEIEKHLRDEERKAAEKVC